MNFHKLEDHFRTPLGMSMLGVGQGSANFADLIRDSQKFYVGDVDLLRLINGPKEIPRLPYELCVFEFQDCDPAGVKRPFFILAEELQYSTGFDCIRTHLFTLYPAPIKNEGIWLHNGCVDVSRKTNTYDSFVNKNTIKFLASGPGFAELANASKIEAAIVSATQWLFSFLLVLNCSNVEVSEIPGPKFLNQKRAKKRKVPIYSYKTLVLKTRQQRLDSGSAGTHDSPRIHLRRGHIKRRKTGNFWWEPCVVGDRKKGIVMKDYKADKLSGGS